MEYTKVPSIEHAASSSICAERDLATIRISSNSSVANGGVCSQALVWPNLLWKCHIHTMWGPLDS